MYTVCNVFLRIDYETSLPTEVIYLSLISFNDDFSNYKLYILKQTTEWE
jgi:hypothetical protein